MTSKSRPLPVLNGSPNPPDLFDHFLQRMDGWTDEEIRRELRLAEQRLERAIQHCQRHSVDYLVDLGLQGEACRVTLKERSKPGYWRKRAAAQRFERWQLDEIKRRASLVDVIGRKHKLRQSGSRYVTNCPFHKPDRTPSFTIYPETASYYCFGCQVSGDIFDWVRHERNLSFRDAVRLLADQYGVRLPDQLPPRPREPFSAPESRKRPIVPESQGTVPEKGGINTGHQGERVAP